MSWDVTRRQIRSLETKLDSSLNQYSRLAVNISGAASTNQGSSAWPGTEVEEGRESALAAGRENAVLEEQIESMLNEVSKD